MALLVAGSVPPLAADASGRAEFVVYENGLWLLSLVHIWRTLFSDPAAEWESAWESFSFMQP